MASVEIRIPDEKLLEYLREQRAFAEGQTHQISVDVEAQPPTANSTISHIAVVTLRYGLHLGELEKLIEF